MRVIFIGAPGSGKGTQAKELSLMFKIRKISLGDILREEVKKNTLLGQSVKGYMDKGLLAPDDVVAKVISQNIPDDGFILDGYPRNLSQAQYLDNILISQNTPLDVVIYLMVDDAAALSRLQLRRVCKMCGANYHLVNLPPKQEGLCDSCGGILVQRDDDKTEVIKERLKIFLSESEPLLSFYKNQGKLVEVDARGDKDDVFDNIRKLVEHGRHTKP